MPTRISQRDIYSVDDAHDIANRYEKMNAFRAGKSKKYFILAGIVVVALALGLSYYYSSTELRNAFLNKIVLGALIIGLIYGAVKSKFSLNGAIMGAVVFAVVVGVAIFFAPAILNAASTYVPQAKDYASKVQLLTNPQSLIDQSPLNQIFQLPKTQAPAQTTLNVQFPSPVSSDPLSVTADVSIKTLDSITLKYSCLLDGAQVEASPMVQSVEGSSSAQQFAVTCLNPKGGKQLSLKVSSQYNVKTILPITVTAGDAGILGVQSSTMLYDGPYALSLDMGSAQPLAKRSASYPFNVKFFRKESGSILVGIGSLDVSAPSSLYTISCNSPLSSLSLSADRVALDKLGDKTKDTYAFPCSLVVNNVPEKGFEQSFINAKASYTIEKEFKTALTSSASVV